MPSKSKQSKGKRRVVGQLDYVALSADLVDAVESGVYIVQSKKFVYVNPFFEKLTGYSREELIGIRSFKLVLPQDRLAVRKKATRNLKSRLGSKPYEYRFIKKNGEIIWVMERVSPIDYMGQKATLGSFVDVTNRKKTEEALVRSEERYRTILEEMQDSYYEVNLAGNFTFVSDSFCGNLGYAREELVGTNYRLITTDKEIKPVFRAFNQVYRTGELNKGFVSEVIRKDGSVKYYESSIALQKNELGEIIGFHCVGRDITERKQKDQALKASEAQYRLLADHMRDQVWLMDLNLKPIYISPSVEKLRGYTFEELAQLPPDRQLTATSFQLAMEFFSTEMPKAQADPTYFARPLELEWYCKDGSTLWVESTFSQIRDENGKPMSLLGVGRDITERKRAEDEVNRQHAFLRQVIDSSPNLIFVKDRDSRYLLANYAIANAYGTTPAYMQGKTDLELGVPAEEFAKYRQDDIEVLQSGKEKIIPDESFSWQSGEVHYYHTTKRPLLDEKGEFKSLLAVSVDITNRKKTEEALAASEERYRTMLERMLDSYYEVDLAGNFTFLNAATCWNLGYGEGELDGKNYRVILPEEEVGLVFSAFHRVYETGEPNTGFSHRVILTDGVIGFAESSVGLLLDKRGHPIGFSCLGRNVTERKKAEEALRESEAQLSASLENAPDGVYMNDLEGNFLYGNRRCEEIIGYKREELIGKNFLELNILPESSLARAAEILQDNINGKGSGPDELELIRKDGRRVPIEINTNVVPRKGQAVVLAFVRDITERKQTQMELKKMATHDFLTGLPNRILLNDRFQVALAQANRNNYKLGIMSLDLDRLKEVNDTMGHAVGDELLKAVAIRLSNILRSSDTVARLGGDEFLLLLQEIHDPEDAILIAEKIIDSCKEPLQINGRQLRISTSIGIAIYPDNGEDMDTLMRKSDAAMYFSKRHGGMQYKQLS